MSIGNKETKSVEGLLTFLGECPVIVDVGSNKGQWTDIIISRFDGNCDIYLFEPNKMLLDFCRIKYEYRKNIKYVNVGLGDKNEVRKFYYFENYNNELSSLYDGGKEWDGLPKQERDIVIHRLSDIIRSEVKYIDYLKIDTEGNDVNVLDGAKEMMLNDQIGIIQLEYGEHYKRGNHSIKEIFDICNETGYSIYRFKNNNYELVTPFEDTWEAEDFFLTKFNIPNYSVGWVKEFRISTADMPKFNFCLEVGCMEGFTTKYICQHLLNDGGRIICVDPLKDFYVEGDTEHGEIFKHQYQRFLRNTYRLPVELIRKESKVALKELHEFRFDMIYLDANHGELEVYEDLVGCYKVCKNEGFIIVDDYEWRDFTKRGIDRFLHEYAKYIEVVSKGYQVVIKKITDI